MPEQPADVRNKNFDEVALGYPEAVAVDEAQRCLNCKNPRCVTGCPVNVDIPEFIHAVTEKDFDGAIHILKRKNSLPAVCGRVCPQETSVKNSASWASRANRWPSAVWNGSWRTGPGNRAPI
jgi:glutamate synthase (NADPH) small chain